MTTAMTFDQFRATGRTVTIAEFASIIGQDEADHLPGDATAVRLFAGNCWIVQTGPRAHGPDAHNWQLILETEEWHTFHDDLRLSDLEAMLFSWEGQDATPSDEPTANALLREACNLLDDVRSRESEAFIGRVARFLKKAQAEAA